MNSIWMWLLVIAVCALALYFGPQISIWALNTLFHTAIPQTWSTWFAVLWISSILSGIARTGVKS